MACIGPGIASRRVIISPRERLYEEVQAVWKACFVVDEVPLSPLLFSSFAAVNWKAVVLIRDRQRSLCCFLPDVHLAADCRLIISSGPVAPVVNLEKTFEYC